MSGADAVGGAPAGVQPLLRFSFPPRRMGGLPGQPAGATAGKCRRFCQRCFCLYEEDPRPQSGLGIEGPGGPGWRRTLRAGVSESRAARCPPGPEGLDSGEAGGSVPEPGGARACGFSSGVFPSGHASSSARFPLGSVSQIRFGALYLLPVLFLVCHLALNLHFYM